MTGDCFRALVEHAPDGIVVSRDGVVLYANAAAARLLGYDDVSEMVGKPMTFLDRQSLEVMRRRIQQMAETGERLVPREYPARRRDGSEMTAEIASTVIEIDGQPAVLAYARDVTERTRMRAQLAHAERLAALGTMAAGVAHEMNNPLAFAARAAEGLARRAGPEHASLVADLRAGLDRAMAIVRDLRSFGRADDEPLGPVDVSAALEAAERLVAHELRPRARLVKELGDLPSVTAVARHLEQVFVNLLLNAARAAADVQDGRVVVGARVTPEHVRVTVQDNGRGIPPERIAALFEPFVTTSRAGEGMGLGLAISRDLLVRAGGDLAARSTPGQGTTMEVTLARAPGGSLGIPSQPRVPAELRAAAAQPRVLVVDDEPRLVQTLVPLLEGHASLVSETQPERAVARLLSDEPFDAVVCDVMMTGLTGVEIHQRVARERPERAARFVFITGGTYTPAAQQYLARLPNAQITKPFLAADLLAAIRRAADAGG